MKLVAKYFIQLSVSTRRMLITDVYVSNFGLTTNFFQDSQDSVGSIVWYIVPVCMHYFLMSTGVHIVPEFFLLSTN